MWHDHELEKDTVGEGEHRRLVEEEGLELLQERKDGAAHLGEVLLELGRQQRHRVGLLATLVRKL